MTVKDGQAGRGIKSVFPPLFVLLAVVSGVASAEDLAPQDWVCRSCPSVAGWELDIEGGPAFVNEDAFRFGDGTGLDEQGAYFFGDLYARYRTEEAGYLVFEGYARGPDANALFFKGGKQSAYELRASVQSIPHRIFATSVTPYNGNGTDRLTLPANWVRAPTTEGMSALDDAAEPVEIGWDRDIYGLGFDVSPTQRWKLRVDYTRQEREGLIRSSGSFFFNGVEFAAPVDDATDDLEVALNYSADTWQVGLTYFGSVFDNEYDDLNWDNPYTAAPGANAGQLAQPPDNESHQVSLAGSMRLPARTTLNGQVSLGHMTQNADLLPYTTNALLPVNPLPTATADAEADTKSREWPFGCPK
jgi:MtrB/PioB family decaheme-associated outer membrane protein